mgnify:CR=1 FL=1
MRRAGVISRRRVLGGSLALAATLLAACQGGATETLVSSFSVTMSEQLAAGPVNTPQHEWAVYNGHTYVRTVAALGWSAAEAYAGSLGGHLVTLDDAAEQAWVYQRFGGSVWLGLNDAGTEGTGVWVDGSGSGYRNWAAGQPD